jgi:hypothetical protein
MGSFFANLRCGWIDSSQWLNILGSKGRAVSTTPFASMSCRGGKPQANQALAVSEEAPTTLGLIYSQTLPNCRIDLTSVPGAVKFLESRTSQQNQRPHTRQSTGAVLFTPGEGTAPVCGNSFREPGGRNDFDCLPTQWKPLRRRISPSARMNVENYLVDGTPRFLRRAPTLGTGESGFLAVRKRKVPADTRFRRKSIALAAIRNTR